MIPSNEIEARPAPCSLREELKGTVLAGGAILGLSSLLLWRNPNLFWNDDYELSILPVFADVARSWSEGHFPLLSPSSWVCGNLAGEFQYGTFSAFVNAAVVLIWKFPLTFAQQAAALSMSHLVALGTGGYLLARGRSLSVPLSVMVAIVAAANGWIICWGATDWFGALGAFTWLPWAWWGFGRALDPRRGRWRFLWPAPFIYLLITGGFPYTVLMLGLLTAWLGLQSIIKTRALSSIWPMTIGALLGTGLSAPAWLALFDYVRGSAREAQGSWTHFQWLVPPSALPGLILPSWTTNWADFSSRLMPHTATEMACGLVAPAALLFGLSRLGRSLVRRIPWELGLLLLVLVISMLPSANVFRWSFRWLPLFHLTLAICAAHALQLLERNGLSAERRGIVFGPGSAAVVLVTVTAGAMFLTRSAGPYGAGFTAITFGLAVLWAAADSLPARFRILRSWTPAAITFAALLATYLSIPPNCGVPRYNLSQQLTKASPLDPQRLYLSVYPAAEHNYRIEKKSGPIGQLTRPGSTSMWGALRFINGYSPIRPPGVAREFGFTIHGEIDPSTGEYLLGWQGGAAGELARLGVDGIVVAKEMDLHPKPDEEWQLVASSDEAYLYHRRGEPLPRVRAITSIDSPSHQQFAPASIRVVEDSRNRVIADVEVPAGDRPALLTFSRPYFNGYRAWIGALRLPVRSDRGAVPAVEVPAGTAGRLTLEYRPWWWTAGAAVAAVCALAIAGGVVLAARERIAARS